MSKFRLTEVHISASCGKYLCFLLLGMVYYWTSSELDMAKVHNPYYVNFCLNAKVHNSICI